MPSGNSRPHISEEHVRSALHSMLYTSEAVPTNALEHLLLVELVLSTPSFPSVSDPRVFALQHVLTSIITQEYQQIRVRLGLQAAYEQQIYSNVVIHIQEDSQSQNPELLGWSILYHRFVRVDLDFKLLSTHMNVDDRTMRRYQKHAVRRLTEKLVLAEWEARQTQKRLRLTASLPSVVREALLGRDDHFRRIQEIIDVAIPCHIQITGAVGVGKSSFAHEIMAYYIDSNAFDQVLWINSPESPQFARAQIIELLSLTDADLKAYTLMYRLGIVLDAVNWDDSRAVNELLQELRGAVVLLTSPTYNSTWIDCQHVLLKDLDEPSSMSLARHLLGQAGDQEVIDDYSHKIWASVGGNPLAIKLAAGHLRMHDLSAVGDQVLDQLFEHSARDLDADARRVWVVLGMLPPEGVHIERLTDLCQVGPAPVQHLIRRHLAQFVPHSRLCSLVTASRSYIQHCCDRRPEFRRVLEMVLESFVSAAALDQAMFPYIEHILFSGWPSISGEQYRLWAEVHVNEGIRQGHYAKWLSILERLQRDESPDISLSLSLAQAILLRHGSNWQQAEQGLIRIVERAGEAGLFVMQGRALVELGTLLRLRGEYELAERLFNRAEKMTLHFAEPELSQQILLERAQLALDQGNGQEAVKILSSLPSGASRVMALYAEAHLLIGDQKSAFSYTQQAVTLVGGNRRVLGRLYVLIARIYESEGDLIGAHDFLAQSVTILEQEEDFAGLARARANLGSVLIGLNRQREAGDLLTRAESMLLWLGDRPALLAVRHNLNILRARFAG